MEYIKLILVLIISITTTVSACSEPEGGYVPPTPAEQVSYATHVLVGTVVKLIYPDPIYTNSWGENSTYGALVQVRCTYKGGVLGDSITIGGAGFIPGMCFSKDLEANKEYILFLHGAQNGMYEQEDSAEPASKLMEYLNVCDLEMQYPMEDGITLKRKVCPQPTQLEHCQKGTQKSPETKAVSGDNGAISMLATSASCLLTVLCGLLIFV